MEKIYKGDIGTEFIVSTGIDLTNATSHKLVIRKPDEQIVDWTTIIKLPSTNGELSHIVISGELDLAGDYNGYAYVEFGTSKFTGSTFEFTVFEPFT